MPQPLQRTLSLRHLRLVSTLGKELNLSRTAEALFTTQPALSRSLAELEDLVGARLFNRTTKHVAATAAGLVLIQHANRVLAELENLDQELAGLRHGVRGALTVGVVPAISTSLLAAAVARVRAMLPDVAITVHTFRIGELYEALLGGRVDLMLAPAELTVDLKLVDVEEVYFETTVVLAAADHPLAGAGEVSEAELARYPWVLPPHGLPVRPRVNNMLALHRTADAGHVPDVETDSFLFAVELVKQCGMLCGVPARVAGQLARLGGVVELQSGRVLVSGPMCALRLRAAPDNGASAALVRSLHDIASP
ncbi:LysR substrate-binding domain-containing protein [Variovorax sp. J31P179]|uniref:LysR family transcriptional regulator n=1 Tax=Variovorax sp. J31P179 TaxID=3053508 RepID=UPI0025771677|nr:LysR substrate-binding domain-containing protein [Variovorax sp. J31P179]MDM0085377.1 LysR substrate-binding domain-containing protein [Variovorax sp. J31P179]